MLGIRVPDPDQVMLISGSGAGDKPFRIARSRKFVLPILNRVDFLRLSLKEANVSEPCVTKQGIEITASAVCAFSIADDDESLYNAGKLFLSGQANGDSHDPRSRTRTIEGSVEQIFAGHLREVVGGMTMEEVTNEREVLRKNVLEASKDEMGRLGLRVHSFQIQRIDDPSGYIENMSASARAAIAQKARIAQAQADQASVEQEQESARKQAEFARDTARAQATYDAEIAEAQAARDERTQVANARANAEIGRETATADQAGPLAQAEASKQVAEAQTALATQQALLREQELEATVVKPAEADAKKTLATAKAQAEATELSAKATASEGRVALDQQMIAQMPEMMKQLANGLAGSNLTILGGATGLTEFSSGLVAQVMTILNTAKEMYHSENGGDGATSTPEPGPPAPPRGQIGT